jgi:hypothetical protein
MKSVYILLCFILNISSFLSQETIQGQKTMLISTNLTKEELYEILSKTEESKNNTSIEEVDSQMISDTETVIKNGKVKMKIKLEFDLNDAQNNKKAFIQTITPIKNEDEKVSLFQYILALGTCLVLIGCFSLSLKMKRNNKFILNKYSVKKDYLLKDY